MTVPKSRCAERESRFPASFLTSSVFARISPNSTSRRACVDTKGAENSGDAASGALGGKKRESPEIVGKEASQKVKGNGEKFRRMTISEFNLRRE
jgi:hypothetical protein